MAKEVSDDVVHLFAAVGRHDQIAKAIAERFGGLVDSISASANSAKPSDLPPDLLQDLAKIPTAVQGISGTERRKAPALRRGPQVARD